MRTLNMHVAGKEVSVEVDEFFVECTLDGLELLAENRGAGKLTDKEVEDAFKDKKRLRQFVKYATVRDENGIVLPPRSRVAREARQRALLSLVTEYREDEEAIDWDEWDDEC